MLFTLDKAFAEHLLDASIPSFQATSRSTLNLGFGHLFYGMARLLRPAKVVAIGSKAGFAPLCFAKALADNEGCGVEHVGFEDTVLMDRRPGHVDFVDPSYSVERGDPNHSFGIGTWDDADDVRRRWESFGLETFITHYKQTSAEYLQSQAADPIDLLYIDGDHSYAGVMHDLTEFRSRLSSDALVLAHDVDPRIPADEGNGHAALYDLTQGLYEFVRIPVYPGLALLRPTR